MEESSAELIIRDFLIPNIIPNLYNKIKTIAAKGVNDLESRVNDFNRLFVFIHTNSIYYRKAWVIADGDLAGKECISKLQKQFNKWPKEHFKNFKKKDFEEYYPKRFSKKVKSVLEIEHGKKKQEAKSELLEEVMQWSLKNRDEAISEFKLSAKEVIDLLKKIDIKMK